MKNILKLAAVVLALTLCVSVFSCGKATAERQTTQITTTVTETATAYETTSSSAVSTSLSETETSTEPTAEPQEIFRAVDTSAFRGLYYLDYTADYAFDGFLSSGGASSSLQLVQYGMSVFPSMKLSLNNLGYGCSAFYAASKDSRLIFGRNFDMDAKNSGSYLIVHTRPEGAYESLSTVNLKFIGINGAPETPEDETSPLLFAPYVPLDGINEKGVSIGVLQLDFAEITQNDAGKTDMTSTSIIRYVLDYAASTDEAIKIFEECNLHTEGFAYHYMIGDANGNGAVIEYVDGKLVTKRFVAADGGALVCANSFVTSEGIAKYGKISADSSKRMAAIVTALENRGFDISVENALHALYSGSQTTTRWSIVFDCTNKTMDIAVHRNVSRSYTFSFEE